MKTSSKYTMKNAVWVGRRVGLIIIEGVAAEFIWLFVTMRLGRR
jgi:hypothetical protein